MVNWYFLRTDIKIAWGFSIKIPTTSAAEMTLLCPPPSTLIGALARGLAFVVEDWSECTLNKETNTIESSTVRILDFVVSAHFGFSTKTISYLCPWSDIMHSYAVPYQQTHHRHKREMWFGVHATGKVYATNLNANVVYVINEEKAKKILGVNWKNKLRNAGYCIQVIGAKEGLVLVRNVEIKEAKTVDERKLIKTNYYLPLDAIERYLPENLCESEFWEHRAFSPHWRKILRRKAKVKQRVSRINYILPLDKIDLCPCEISVHLSNKGIGLITPDDVVVLLKEWLT